MSADFRILAVIPARGGSKGLPGKNVRLFAGLPLLAHSILFARACPEIDRSIVSTDSPEIAKVARDFGAEVPFPRPPELARDESPLWPVLRHALSALEGAGPPYDGLLLLDPTSPARDPKDLQPFIRRLKESPEADGIISVSRPIFNPIWHCVLERNGWMENLMDEAVRFDRRQDVPPVYRIDGSLYLWRTRFVRREADSWRRGGRHLLYEIPESRAMSIDDLDQFERAELLVRSGKIPFPWMEGAPVPCPR
ncbi:MAG: acylneuraminate cytidylyltransferase family protein [Candidatus Omnitrophica bacterium]|nr:acylneuraminate cytidylyltransferase family protein [Candidatus Omnitrophota bacterium]